MRMPIQNADALPDLLEVQKSSSVLETFRRNLGGAESTGGSSLLRPLKFAVIKALFDLGQGQHYWLVFRGFHALLLVAAVLLFANVLGVRTWSDFAAGSFALTVLTGMHTFAGALREAFPINHTLEVIVCCLIALNLARSRGGWPVDAAAALTFVAAALTLESGLLVWVIVVVAWLTGLRGISTRGVILVTALLAAYLGTRFFALSVSYPTLAERNSGFLLEQLEGAEIAQRFGDHRLLFYGYNVIAAMLSVLFTEPQGGVFEFVRHWRDGDVPPRLYVAVGASLLSTGFIVCAVARRWWHISPDRTDLWRWFVLFPLVLAGNAAISFAYLKDEIVGPAGVLYACAAYAAARLALDAFDRPRSALRRAAAGVLLFAMAGLWAFRSAGLHHVLRVQAFKQRVEWANTEEPRDGRARALVHRLRQDALAMPVPTPDLLGEWAERWWGE